MAKTAEYTRRAVENYRAKFDTAQIRLPKGTRERAKAVNANINDIAVAAVLAYLEDREKELMQVQQKTVQEPEKKASAYRDMPEDLQAANEWLHQIQEQNAKKNNCN